MKKLLLQDTEKLHSCNRRFLLTFFRSKCVFDNITFWVTGLHFLGRHLILSIGCILPYTWILSIHPQLWLCWSFTLLDFLTSIFSNLSYSASFESLTCCLDFSYLLHFAGYMDCCCLNLSLDFLPFFLCYSNNDPFFSTTSKTSIWMLCHLSFWLYL